MEILCGWLLWLLVVLMVYLGIRNTLVYRERKRILDKALKAVYDQVPGEYARLMELHDSVSYNAMLLKFWKPVKSFYEEPL